MYLDTPLKGRFTNKAANKVKIKTTTVNTRLADTFSTNDTQSRQRVQDLAKEINKMTRVNLAR